MTTRDIEHTELPLAARDGANPRRVPEALG